MLTETDLNYKQRVRQLSWSSQLLAANLVFLMEKICSLNEFYLTWYHSLFGGVVRAFTTTVFVGKLALLTRQMNLAKSTKIKMR